jgi:Uma2 family endonuclease
MEIIMAIQDKIRTAEDLWELSHRPEYADMRLELSEGRLIVMSPASWKHGGLASKLDRRVGDFAEENELGMTTGAETGYILFKNPDPEGKDIVRAPDVGFIRAERVPDELPDRGYVPFAPDLAVEVVSPDDSADEVAQKVAEYLKYGTRLVWVLYAKPKEIKVHAPDQEVKTLKVGDALDGGDVLPGFKMPVRDIFPK